MIVIVGLFLLFLGTLLEALIYSDKQIWILKTKVATVAAFLLAMSNLFLLYNANNVWLLIVGIISLYKLINLGRLIVNRLPPKHLKSLAARSFMVLSLLQASVLLLWQVFWLILDLNIPAYEIVNGAIVVAFIASIIVLSASIVKLLKSQPIKSSTLSDSELPTLSVAIAARNESPSLTACLESLVADEYPKLEILVLDDESQDTTADIIKSFAKDGVRFVRHQVIKGEWLAKNNAYQTLLEHSSGQLLMFVGVDTRFHKQTLRGVVEQFITRDVDMLTVFPKRTKSGVVAAFIQPMRYWWELAIPSLLLKRPPALSTSWLVDSEKIRSIGGFASFKRSITPEDHLAKHFAQSKKYAFIRTNKSMLLTTHKDFKRQWDTAIRTRYPHAHRRPENVFLQSVALTWLVILPFFIAVFLVFTDVLAGPFNWLVIFSVLAYLLSHVLISTITNPMAAWLAPLNFPVAIFLDIVALNVSMFKYEFSRIIWKGRDVAPIKLQVISHLPPIEDNK